LKVGKCEIDSREIVAILGGKKEDEKMMNRDSENK
jgi:hypothetical protein